MKPISTAVFLAGLLILCAPVHAETITVFGATGSDPSGKPAPMQVSEELYRASLKKVLTTVQASTLSTMNKTRASQFRSQDSKQDWHLRVIGVGLSVELSAGIGPLIKLGGKSSMHFIFSNTSSFLEP